MGYSKYPNQLDDSTSLPPSTDLVTAVNAEVVNRLRDAILALEQELDAQPSGTYGTVRARLDAMQAQIASEERQGAEGTVKISSTDTTFNFLEGKLVAGTNITIVRQNAGGDETLKISGSGGAHAITHEDGGSDEVTAQNLGSGAAVVDKVMVTDGAGGWTLEDYAAFVAHAPTHEDGGADEITAQNLGSGAAAIDQVMITDGAGGWTLGDYLPAHAATHEDGGVDELIAQDLSSGAAPDGYVMVTNGGGWVLAGSAPPGAHAWTHEEGGVDELLAQDLGSGAAPDGYIMVADGLGGWVVSYNDPAPAPHAETHEQDGIDELVAQYLSSNGADDGYIMIADGLGGWRMELPSGGSKIVPGVSGYQDTQADSWEEVGGLIFNPLEFVGSTFEFEALIQTTIIAKAANIRLYNITDGAVVTDSVLSSTSLVPDLVSVVLTAPDDLPNDEKIYAVQVKMSIAGGPNERCICKAAHIKVS